MAFTCWLTRQCEGPWWMRMRTMSTSPRQAARCSGKQPLLSATSVDASNWSSFSTTSLRETDTYIHAQINISTDRKMEGWREGEEIGCASSRSRCYFHSVCIYNDKSCFSLPTDSFNFYLAAGVTAILGVLFSITFAAAKMSLNNQHRISFFLFPCAI